MSSRYGDEIVVVRAPRSAAPGRNGQRPWLWDQAQRSEPAPASVQWQGSKEDDVGRQTSTSTWHLHAGYDLDLLATDRVEWGGLTLEVDGEVGRLKHRGRPHHVEAVLKMAADS